MFLTLFYLIYIKYVLPCNGFLTDYLILFIDYISCSGCSLSFSKIQWSLEIWPWTNELISLCLGAPYYKMKIKTCSPYRTTLKVIINSHHSTEYFCEKF